MLLAYAIAPSTYVYDFNDMCVCWSLAVFIMGHHWTIYVLFGFEVDWLPGLAGCLVGWCACVYVCVLVCAHASVTWCVYVCLHACLHVCLFVRVLGWLSDCLCACLVECVVH